MEKIIDVHMHLGKCRVFGLEITRQQLLEYISKYNLTAVIVQPFPGAPNPIEVHNEIYELGIKFPKKIYGLASVNPLLDEDYVKKELERALGSLGFVGVKLHTAGHSISPANPRSKILFDTAAKYKVPVMIHTGPGPFSDPALALDRIEEYPDVKIILAHAGFGVYFSTAYLLAKKYDNVYLDTSWTYVYDLAKIVAELPDKILFATDLIENAPVEFAKVEALRLRDDIREKYLFTNAKKVFNLNI